MPAPQNLRAAGDRIEQLLDEVQAAADLASCRRTEELLRLVSELYGAGLAAVVALVRQRAPELLDVLAGDELVASLLVVHGLHPDDVTRRVERALAGVRPLLARHGGDVELLSVDSETGTVRLRLLGSCDGCPSSSVTLQMAVERAISEAAPEIARIDVAESSSPPPSGGTAPAQAATSSVPVHLSTKPVYGLCPSAVVGT